MPVTDEGVLPHVKNYSKKLSQALDLDAMNAVPDLAQALREAWEFDATVYLCGNGGSAANAIHLANDFLYGAGVSNGVGLKPRHSAPTPPSSRRSLTMWDTRTFSPSRCV